MSDAINSGRGYRGFQDDNTGSSGFNAQAFVIWSILSKISTVTVVKVMGVAGGFVDIMPLVNQIDGAGNAFKHGTIYKCPFWRLQGGSSGVILDPVVGDLGIALFADRDISSVIKNKGRANPGSRRRFDMADALYLGGLLNAEPTQFVKLAADGITLESLEAIMLNAPDVQINAQTVEIVATTSVAITSPSLKHNGVNIGATHQHSGVTTGGGVTGTPLP